MPPSGWPSQMFRSLRCVEIDPLDLEIAIELRDMAARILAWEREQPARREPIACALERLRSAMTTLVGPRGFEAILLRALHLAKHEHAPLAEVATASGADVDAVAMQCARAGEPHAWEASVALLSTVLHLFCVFLREDLTLLQVRRAWGEVPFDGERPASPEEK